MRRAALVFFALVATVLVSLSTGSPALADFSPVDWFEGADGFERAVEEARSGNKPLLVYFRTDWCPYCRQFEDSLLASEEVEIYLDKLVRVTINPEAGREEAQLASAYGVRGYPALFLHPPGPAEPRTIRRTTSQNGQLRLQTPVEFVQTLARAAHE
ncbi:MAG: thioredoxin family protein [Thermoanaerobaculia bacterium]|nr:thioredoxin family protein [Thermoanaerobaculia bacterium]